MNKRYRLEIKEEAATEIEEAYNYYEEQKVGLGDSFIKFLDNTFHSISKSPSGFKVVSNQRRQAVVDKFPFVVIYEVFEKTIVVFAVFHTSRKPTI